MKKLFNIIYFIALLTSALTAQHITGSGVSVDPYVLYDYRDVDSIRYLGEAAYYKLNNDITFPDTSVFHWVLFTQSSTAYHVDGNFKKISNLVLEYQAGSYYQGLFPNISSAAEIKNLTLNNFNFTQSFYLTSSGGTSYFGIFAAYGLSTNCRNIKVINSTMSFTMAPGSPNNFSVFNASIISSVISATSTVEFISAENCSISAININGASGVNASILPGTGSSATLRYSFVKGCTMNISRSASYADVGLLSRYNISIYDCYAINNTIENSEVDEKPTMFTGSDNYTGVSRVYVAQDTFYNYATTTRYAFARDLTGNAAACYIDTVGMNQTAIDGNAIGTAPTIKTKSELYQQATYVGWDFATVWAIDTTKIINDGFPYFINFPPEPDPDLVKLYNPNGGEYYTEGDTIQISYSNENSDSLKIYLSVDGGTTYSFLTEIDTSINPYVWTAPAIYTLNAKILITDNDSTFIDESENSFTIIPISLGITILDPTETSQTITGNKLKVTVETYSTDHFELLYKLQSQSEYTSIDDSVIVDPGDGLYPDTTNYYWDISNIPLTAEGISLLARNRDSLFTWTGENPFYDDTTYVSAGRRSPYALIQSISFWSDFYLYNDELYTMSFYGYLWGWYDYQDVISIYRFNKTTDLFEPDYSLSTPGAAYFPDMTGYRSSPTRFILDNNKTGSSHLSKYADIVLPGTIGSFYDAGNYYFTSIDTGHTFVVYDGWSYTLNTSTGQITAKDLINPENYVFVVDITTNPLFTDPTNIDFIVHDGLIIAGRRNGAFAGTTSSGVGSTAYIIGASLPINSALSSDEVSFVLQGAYRNFFRGVYPNAIIEYFPPIR